MCEALGSSIDWLLLHCVDAENSWSFIMFILTFKQISSFHFMVSCATKLLSSVTLIWFSPHLVFILLQLYNYILAPKRKRVNDHHIYLTEPQILKIGAEGHSFFFVLLQLYFQSVTALVGSKYLIQISCFWVVIHQCPSKTKYAVLKSYWIIRSRIHHCNPFFAIRFQIISCYASLKISQFVFPNAQHRLNLGSQNVDITWGLGIVILGCLCSML